MDSIFLIVCETGEYEEYEKWNMGAFTTIEQAEKICEKLQSHVPSYLDDRYYIEEICLNKEDIGWLKIG